MTEWSCMSPLYQDWKLVDGRRSILSANNRIDVFHCILIAPDEVLRYELKLSG